MWAICKKEWTQYFSSLSGYLVIIFYLLTNSLFLFVLPALNVLDFGYASLQVYFDYAPWFLLILIPSITMHSFSDEYKLGTYELLKSLPIKPLQLLLGKFLGLFSIVLMALTPSLLYALALDQLSITGGLDWGATWGAYIGLLCLSAVFVSIGIFISSYSTQALTALLLSILACAFIFKGFEWLSTLSFFQNGYDFYVEMLGVKSHYENISKGVVLVQDVSYFLSLIILCILGGLEKHTAQKAPLGMLLLIVIVNILVLFYPIQLDLTKDRRFTLSNTSKEVVNALEQPITIKLFLGGDLPKQYKKMAASAQSLLDNLQKLNQTKVQWEIVVPSQQYKDTALYQVYDSLVQLGLPIERVQSDASSGDQRIDQLIIPGVLIEMEGKQPIAIDLRTGKKYYKPYNIVKDIPEEDLDASSNAAASLLEYKIIQAIYSLNRTAKPTIAYLIGNGEPIDLSVNDLGQSIRHQYDLKLFDLQKGFPLAPAIKTLLIVKPSIPFTEMDKFKLDQYVMSGGNIIWAIDKLYAQYDSLQKTSGEYIAYDRNLNLDDLFFKYGIRINPNLVQDLNCSKLPIVVGKDPAGNAIIQRLPWPYYPLLNGNINHRIVKNIDRIITAFPSSLDTVKTIGLSKTILLSTDTNSRIVKSPNLISLKSGMEENALSSFTKHRVPIAALVEGKFTSLFAHKITAAFKDSIFLQTGHSFQNSGLEQSKQLFIADADILTNYIDKTNGPLPMGMLPFDQVQFGNKEFFNNAIVYLNEPINLLDARNKQYVLRTLNKEKVEQQKLYWQLGLCLGPLFIFGLLQFIWIKYRKSQFAV